MAPVHPRARVQHPEDIRLLWIVGSNAAGQMGNAQAKWRRVRERQGSESQFPASTKPGVTLRNLKKRIKNSGLVIVQQDIYPTPTTQFADLILPAAGWGEEDFTRYTGERRLRLYGKFQDPPAHRCRGEPVALWVSISASAGYWLM